jgi:hypothetical protein
MGALSFQGEVRAVPVVVVKEDGEACGALCGVGVGMWRNCQHPPVAARRRNNRETAARESWAARAIWKPGSLRRRRARTRATPKGGWFGGNMGSANCDHRARRNFRPQSGRATCKPSVRRARSVRRPWRLAGRARGCGGSSRLDCAEPAVRYLWAFMWRWMLAWCLFHNPTSPTPRRMNNLLEHHSWASWHGHR